MAKKLLMVGLIGFSVYFRAQAQLAITEVMSGENDKNHPDWYELHNYGTNNIDLTGYSWNDDAHGGFSGADTAPFTGVTIHSNETIIVTEQKGVVTDAASFRTWWNLDSSVQVVVLNSADPGLSANPFVTGAKRADSVRLWNTNLAALGSNTNGLDLDECPEYLVQRADLGNTTNQSLLFDPVNGMYDILSVNGVGGADASVNGEIGSPDIAPAAIPGMIDQTPASQTVTIGNSVSFTNGGTALPPLIFHWYFNNNPITSQTPGVSIQHITPGLSLPLTNDISVLTLTSAQTTNAGTYKVIASNGLQSFTNTATLTVNATPTPPSILSYSPNLKGSFDGYFGQTIDLSVVAGGYPAPTYQWCKDNNLISGQTSADYVLSLSATNQSGIYSVIVTNSSGGTNVSFTINVTPVPNLIVTEVMSGESTNNSNGDTSGHGDWFELSNFGNFPVNLYGYRIDDSHDSLVASAEVTNQMIIHSGESVVFVQDMTPDQFRAWWGPNLSPRVQIIDYNGSGQGLSGSGDAVNVWNAVASQADQVAAATFFTGTDGVTFGFDPTHLDSSGFDGVSLSANGINGAFAAVVGGDIGSPGTIVNVPRFTGIASHTGGGFQLSWFTQPNWTNIVQFKNNLTDPNWTTLTTVAPAATTNDSYLDPTTSTQRFYRVILNIQN